MTESPKQIGNAGNSIREAFGIAIQRLGQGDDKIVLLDADVAGGTGGHHFRSSHIERFIQCGIAEQNMVGVAAGLAMSGFKPWVSTFGVFLLRGLEQIRLAVAYPGLAVTFVGSHSGIDVGPDGASAQALEDIAAFRSLPNMSVIVPGTPRQMELAVEAVSGLDRPVYLRSGRSPVRPAVFDDEWFLFGKAQVLREGSDFVLIACGTPLSNAFEAALALADLGYSVGMVNVPTIKPIDEATILRVAASARFLITIEDHNVIGGLGSAVVETVSTAVPKKVYRLGLPDVPGQSGDPEQLYRAYGLDVRGIFNRVKEIVEHEFSK